MKYSHDEYFSCYSPPLKEYLESNGIMPVARFVNIRTEKICWVFKRTAELPAYLDQWSINKKSV